MCGGETIDYNITSVSNKMTIQFKGVDRASITTDGTISFNISYSRTKGMDLLIRPHLKLFLFALSLPCLEKLGR